MLENNNQIFRRYLASKDHNLCSSVMFIHCFSKAGCSPSNMQQRPSVNLTSVLGVKGKRKEAGKKMSLPFFLIVLFQFLVVIRCLLFPCCFVKSSATLLHDVKSLVFSGLGTSKVAK